MTRPVVPLAEKDEAMSLERQVTDVMHRAFGSFERDGLRDLAVEAIEICRESIARDIEAEIGTAKARGAVAWSAAFSIAARIARGASS